MSSFKDYSETPIDKVYEQDMKETEKQCYDNFFSANLQLGESGQVIPNLSFTDMYSYSDPNPVHIQQQSPQNWKFPHIINKTPEVDDLFFPRFCSSLTPESYVTQKEIPTRQQEFGTFLIVPKEDAESIGFNFNEDEAINMSSFNSPAEHQVVDQLGESYPGECDYQLTNNLQTPPCRNSQYQIYGNNSASSLTPSDQSDLTFPPLSWWGHNYSEMAIPQYSPLLAISEGIVGKKATKNSSERSFLKSKLSCESVNINKDATSSTHSTNSKKLRHYSSAADISSAYQRRKQLNRHKMSQYRSVSPCLQIRKRRSARGLKATEPCGNSVGKVQKTDFVNYTPEDSEKILTGVAPSGSNKTKARREREALEKRQKLSQAALRAVEAVGGDTSGLVEEEFFVQN